MSSTAEETVLAMPAAFLPERAGDAKAQIQLDLTGEDSGQWYLDIADGKCQAMSGQAPQPNVTVTMSGKDFVALFNNRLNPVQAFMSGQIKIAGNAGFVLQLLNWFER
ncbi:MAG: SCP2 sterol-binding domain-containing protein [Anaerolineae bacterium]|jgi:putative sterol carrier protein